MVMLLLVPLSEMVKPLVGQIAAVTVVVCCKIQPVEGDGHETVMLRPEYVMVKVGAPAVCTTEIKLQKPPVNE